MKIKIITVKLDEQTHLLGKSEQFVGIKKFADFAKLLIKKHCKTRIATNNYISIVMDKIAPGSVVI